MQPNEKIFRYAFWPVFIFIASLGILAGVGISLVIFYGKPIPCYAYVLSVLAGLTFACIGSFINRWLFPVRVTAEGLHGHSFGGQRRFLSWSELECGGRAGLFPLPMLLKFLKVYSRLNEHRIWLPLNLERRDEFRRTVQDFAPDCPLLKHL
jgi:hypothetical protein